MCPISLMRVPIRSRSSPSAASALLSMVSRSTCGASSAEAFAEASAGVWFCCGLAGSTLYWLRHVGRLGGGSFGCVAGLRGLSGLGRFVGCGGDGLLVFCALFGFHTAPWCARRYICNLCSLACGCKRA
jgi:hypothetical protein